MLNELDNSVNIYTALQAPHSEVWTQEQSKLIEEIQVLNVSQCFPLLMMAKKQMD
ncbi:MAG: hypothetical protein R2795_21290 [Saprospiraceae bacterium]